MSDVITGIRPIAAYSFVRPPEKINGVWVWENIRIIEKEGMGKHVQMRFPQQGTLVPYGGVKISRKWFINAKKCRKEIRPDLDYVYDSGRDIIYDCRPGLIHGELNIWPAGYLNEVSIDSGDKFNCELVVIETAKYPDVPDYPHIEKAEFMQFIEVMSVPRASNTVNEGWVDMWLYYGDVSNPAKIFKQKGYYPEVFCERTRDWLYKSHWPAGSLQIETAELGQKKREVEEESVRRNTPISKLPGRHPPSQLGQKIPKHSKKRYRSYPPGHPPMLKIRVRSKVE